MPTDSKIWDAPTDTQIWDAACERVGIIPAPAIDDSDAAMKMIAWALKHQLTVCIGPRWVILHNDRGSNVGEGDNFDNDSSRTTPLALAAAVLAVKE